MDPQRATVQMYSCSFKFIEPAPLCDPRSLSPMTPCWKAGPSSGIPAPNFSKRYFYHTQKGPVLSNRDLKHKIQVWERAEAPPLKQAAVKQKIHAGAWFLLFGRLSLADNGLAAAIDHIVDINACELVAHSALTSFLLLSEFSIHPFYTNGNLKLLTLYKFCFHFCEILPYSMVSLCFFRRLCYSILL